MRVLLLTNEYPPYIYGGAGVHVEYLSRELSRLTTVEVRNFHNQDFSKEGLTVRGIKVDRDQFQGCPNELLSTLCALETCMRFNGWGIEADIVHCHTWYTHFGGILAKVLYGIPLVITVHSLEPLRPWKREQIGRGYELSSWVEKVALEIADSIIAVSNSTRDDILRLFKVDKKKISVIPNGIDTYEYKPTHNMEILLKYGVDYLKPYVLFVGRMTRQKGLYYLLLAIPKLDPSIQVVLCAGESDTPAMQMELEAMVSNLKANRASVIWIPEMVDRQTVIALYSQASVFCCPSIYEPFGIINLEAMACGAPVVGSRIGGIPEVVVDGITGILVDLQLSPIAPHNPTDPDSFATNLANGINKIVLNPNLRASMAATGRKRVKNSYSWSSIAEQTLSLYKSLHERHLVMRS